MPIVRNYGSNAIMNLGQAAGQAQGDAAGAQIEAKAWNDFGNTVWNTGFLLYRDVMQQRFQAGEAEKNRALIERRLKMEEAESASRLRNDALAYKFMESTLGSRIGATNAQNRMSESSADAFINAGGPQSLAAAQVSSYKATQSQNEADAASGVYKSKSETMVARDKAVASDAAMRVEQNKLDAMVGIPSLTADLKKMEMKSEIERSRWLFETRQIENKRRNDLIDQIRSARRVVEDGTPGGLTDEQKLWFDGAEGAALSGNLRDPSTNSIGYSMFNLAGDKRTDPRVAKQSALEVADKSTLSLAYAMSSGGGSAMAMMAKAQQAAEQASRGEVGPGGEEPEGMVKPEMLLKLEAAAMLVVDLDQYQPISEDGTPNRGWLDRSKQYMDRLEKSGLPAMADAIRQKVSERLMKMGPAVDAEFGRIEQWADWEARQALIREDAKNPGTQLVGGDASNRAWIEAHKKIRMNDLMANNPYFSSEEFFAWKAQKARLAHERSMGGGSISMPREKKTGGMPLNMTQVDKNSPLNSPPPR